jgi:hypothetical protein
MLLESRGCGLIFPGDREVDKETSIDHHRGLAVRPLGRWALKGTAVQLVSQTVHIHPCPSILRLVTAQSSFSHPAEG